VLVVSPAGRILRELHRGELAAGSHAFTWDGRTGDGNAVSSGIYFFRIDAGGVSRSMPVTMLH
jgi:flagellar hook assembly protein FlgD